MQHIEEKINYLNSLGINYNLESGKNWIFSDLSSYHDIEDENYPLRLIIREMGNHLIGDTNGNPFCKKASTFVHDQFFLSGKISDIFFELQRITNGNFSFKTIQEFKLVDNIDGSRSIEEFWNEPNE